MPAWAGGAGGRGGRTRHRARGHGARAHGGRVPRRGAPDHGGDAAGKTPTRGAGALALGASRHAGRWLALPAVRGARTPARRAGDARRGRDGAGHRRGRRHPRRGAAGTGRARGRAGRDEARRAGLAARVDEQRARDSPPAGRRLTRGLRCRGWPAAAQRWRRTGSNSRRFRRRWPSGCRGSAPRRLRGRRPRSGPARRSVRSSRRSAPPSRPPRLPESPRPPGRARDEALAKAGPRRTPA